MDKINKVMAKSFITNISLALLKIISGILGKSGALIADGIHSFSDMLNDIFAVVGNTISKKPADFEHPFGHGNAEYLTCLVIGLLVGIMGINVIKEGIFSQSNIPNILTAIIVIITIFAKILLSKYLLKKGKEYENDILTSSGKESLSDVISSLVVLLSVLFSKIFPYSDKIAMVIVGFLILRIAYEILKENLSNLLGKQETDKEYINNLKQIINSHKEIKDIDELIIIKYGSSKKIDCEVSMDKNMILEKVHKTIDKIEKEVKRKDKTVSNIIIHVNPY
ncbi:MAG: cation transporter [Bacilli bacterium]|nr:cation transporter [Bacilli bacterium]